MTMTNPELGRQAGDFVSISQEASQLACEASRYYQIKYGRQAGSKRGSFERENVLNLLHKIYEYTRIARELLLIRFSSV